jgi:predicted RNA polymerase sigma factor
VGHGVASRTHNLVTRWNMANWQNCYLAHSARANMYRRLGRTAEARSAYEKALALTQQEPEWQFLQEQIRQLN